MKNFIEWIKRWTWIGIWIITVITIAGILYAATWYQDVPDVGTWSWLTSAWYNQLLANVRDLDNRVNNIQTSKITILDNPVLIDDKLYWTVWMSTWVVVNLNSYSSIPLWATSVIIKWRSWSNTASNLAFWVNVNWIRVTRQNAYWDWNHEDNSIWIFKMIWWNSINYQLEKWDSNWIATIWLVWYINE